MAQSNEDQSVVDVGKAQRAGDWPKPGDEGFVHPDGTPYSMQQLRENRQAAMNRAAAGSAVHGAPGQGGVQPVPMVAAKPSDLTKAQAEHTQFVRDGLAALVEATEADTSDSGSKGRHESTGTTTTKGA